MTGAMMRRIWSVAGDVVLLLLVLLLIPLVILALGLPVAIAVRLLGVLFAALIAAIA